MPAVAVGRGGQKPKLGPRQARLAQEMYEAGQLTVAEIAAEFGVTRPTISGVHQGGVRPAR
ncbi:Hin recombinase [Pseudonocardia sp. KRD-291]|nr:Hin recombinase [Pseudonocardia sp. KRD291]